MFIPLATAQTVLPLAERDLFYATICPLPQKKLVKNVNKNIFKSRWPDENVKKKQQQKICRRMK